MKDLIALRDFRLVDKGLNLKSGGALSVEDEYFDSSRALRAAMKVGWIDLKENVADGDRRFVGSLPKPTRPARHLQPVVEQEDAQARTKKLEEGLKVTPAAKNTVDAKKANEAAMKRAAERMDRLKAGETPIGTGLSFKSTDVADDVVGIDDVNEQLAIRQQRRIDAEKNYRRSMDKKSVKAEVVTDPQAQPGTTTTGELRAEDVTLTSDAAGDSIPAVHDLSNESGEASAPHDGSETGEIPTAEVTSPAPTEKTEVSIKEEVEARVSRRSRKNKEQVTN